MERIKLAVVTASREPECLQDLLLGSASRISELADEHLLDLAEWRRRLSGKEKSGSGTRWGGGGGGQERQKSFLPCWTRPFLKPALSDRLF